MLIRNLFLLITIVLVVWAGYKLISGANKIPLYSKVNSHLNHQELTLAEPLFIKADNNHSINYKNKEISDALAALKPK